MTFADELNKYDTGFAGDFEPYADNGTEVPSDFDGAIDELVDDMWSINPAVAERLQELVDNARIVANSTKGTGIISALTKAKLALQDLENAFVNAAGTKVVQEYNYESSIQFLRAAQQLNGIGSSVMRTVYNAVSAEYTV